MRIEFYFDKKVKYKKITDLFLKACLELYNYYIPKRILNDLNFITSETAPQLVFYNGNKVNTMLADLFKKELDIQGISYEIKEVTE